MITCPKCRHQFSPAWKPPTSAQMAVLVFVEHHIRDHGTPPTQETIARGLGYHSLATVNEHLVSLERKGIIHRAYNERAAISILVSSDEIRGLAPRAAAPPMAGVAE